MKPSLMRLNLFESMVLRRIFGLAGGLRDCITRSSTNCTLHQIYLGLFNQREWDERAQGTEESEVMWLQYF
jgi:hypothetical protein